MYAYHFPSVACIMFIFIPSRKTSGSVCVVVVSEMSESSTTISITWIPENVLSADIDRFGVDWEFASGNT
jgi:hypothetical protein